MDIIYLNKIAMKKLKILWLDDQREPYSYFKKVRNNSGAWQRNNDFYQNNIFNQYDVEFIWVKNIEEFTNYIIENGVPEFVSFDFDLKNGRTKVDGPVPNGGDCTQWLINYCKENNIKMPKCFAHTANKTQRPLLNGLLGLTESKPKKIIITEGMLNKLIRK